MFKSWQITGIGSEALTALFLVLVGFFFFFLEFLLVVASVSFLARIPSELPIASIAFSLSAVILPFLLPAGLLLLSQIPVALIFLKSKNQKTKSFVLVAVGLILFMTSLLPSGTYHLTGGTGELNYPYLSSIGVFTLFFGLTLAAYSLINLGKPTKTKNLMLVGCAVMALLFFFRLNIPGYSIDASADFENPYMAFP